MHEPVPRAGRMQEMRAYTLPVVPNEDAERPLAERVEADRALVMLDARVLLHELGDRLLDLLHGLLALLAAARARERRVRAGVPW